MLTPEKLAKLWHDKYTEVAREQGVMLKGSPAWDEIPTMARRTYAEVCRRVLAEIDLEDEPYNPKPRRTWPN